MSTRQLLGFGGAATLFVGVFAPIVSLPFAGGINYFQNGRGDGAIVIVLAAASAWLTATRRYSGLYVTGLLSTGLLSYTYFGLQNILNAATEQMRADLVDNPFAGLAELAIQSVQIQWGWALLVIGTVALLAAAAIKDSGDPPVEYVDPWAE